MKTKVNIFDNNFSHAVYSSDFQSSNNIEWVRNFEFNPSDLCFLTDSYLFSNLNGDNLIGWILEPRGINNQQYERIITENTKFKKILTYDKILLESNSKFEFYPHCGCWISPEDQKIYEKNKFISYISSIKNFGARGHKLRAEVREKFKHSVDLFGRGHKDIPYKLDGLKDYMFSIVIENTMADYYFTEKIIDCFVTGTIPIYWGCPSIGNFFNTDSILTFNSIEELENIISNLSPEFYLSKMDSIKNNFEKSKEFLLAEDWIFNNVNIFKQ